MTSEHTLWGYPAAIIASVMSAITFGATHAYPAAPRPAPCSASNWRGKVTVDEGWIIAHEHGEKRLSQVSNYTATHDPNPSSSAFGLGQLLYSTRAEYYPRHASLGSTDPCIQLRGMRNYIDSRYGGAGSARNFWVRHHYY